MGVEVEKSFTNKKINDRNKMINKIVLSSKKENIPIKNEKCLRYIVNQKLI